MRSREEWRAAGRAFHLLANRLQEQERIIAVYTALEKHRVYSLGTARLLYLGRDFPDDHPPIFSFRDLATGEIIAFSLDQLTSFEEQGALHYLGPVIDHDSPPQQE